MRKLYISIVQFALVALFFLVMPEQVSGQKKKATRIAVNLEVIDGNGMPVESARVASSRNRYTYEIDSNGKISLSVLPADVLKIMSDGYETQVVNASDFADGALKVILKKLPEHGSESDKLYTLPGDYIDGYRTVGSYSKVDGEELEVNPSTFLWDALGGRLNGLFAMDQSVVPGFSTWSGFVRSPNGGTPIIMIDGVERSLDYIEPETIESVQLLKDASLKSLFGGVQSNGIILIKTKRGKPYENGVRVNVQSGVAIPTRLPGYMNSREYTTMYNQALANVGKSPVYDPSKYDGSNPLLYPDVDYYGQFLNKFMTETRANAQLTGGNENTRYFVHLGYQTYGGLEAYTDYPNRDEIFTVRGNVDNTIFDFITLRVGINAAIESKKWPNTSTQNFMSSLADTRPNEYPITIPGEMAGSSAEYVLGGTATGRDNPLGLLTQNGYVQREYSYLQSDFVIDIDLDKWVKGLSIRPAVTFDFYNGFSNKKAGGFSVYEPVPDIDGGVTSFKNWGYDNPNTSQTRGDVEVERNWMVSATVKYDRVFHGKHELTALATGFVQRHTWNTTVHSLKRANVGIAANYMYDKKYVVDASLNYVGVPSFSSNNRFGLFPTIGAGWVISENDFMKEAEWVDYLKLRASYGVLGSTLYDDKGIVSNYYYRDEWSVGGTYSFPSFASLVAQTQTGNLDAGFQKSREFNAGIDFELLEHSLYGSVGYFYNYLDGGLANETDATPGVSGKGGALYWSNCKAYMSQGAEAELYYTRTFGDFHMTVGGNLSYGYSDVVKEVDVPYPDELSALKKIVRNGDTKGYTVIGTFKDQADIDASPKQTFGNVYPGDLKYEDKNNDGVIDERDMSVVANIQPSMQYGISIRLKYKGFNLDLLGYGIAGFDRMLSNKYYQIYGDRKYSDVLFTGLPNGNPHPVVRADNSTNNFVDSNYWVVDGGYFKLRNAELGYTLPHKVTKKIGLNVIKVFVRGTNLFTISKIKDRDPENIDAGVGNFPLATTLTAGLSLSF